MSTLNKVLQKYLIWALPVVIATMIWSSFQQEKVIRATSSTPVAILWEVMSWSLILWFACLLVFMVLLAFRKDTQESTVKYLAGIKERDEREEVIMGMAAKRTFIATTGFLIFLLFLSCFRMNIIRLPEGQTDGKRNSLSLGFEFSSSDLTPTIAGDGNMYEHRDIPLSKSAIILLILIWQIGAFRFKVRQDLKEA